MGQTTRQEQIAAFFQDHEEEVQKLARQEAWWPRPAGDTLGLDAFLLPQGFQRPEVETYAELLERLQYHRERTREAKREE